MQSLHETLIRMDARLFVATAGAGLRFLSGLWAQPGASSYWIGAITPYAQGQLAAFLGYVPIRSFCSREVALDLATMSYIQACEQRALEGSQQTGFPIGLGITASVASIRMPRGAQRAHLCVVTEARVRHVELRFEKAIGGEARAEHDAQLARAARELLEAVVLGKNAGDDATDEAMQRLFAYPCFEIDGRRTKTSAGSPACYVPATLNPLHEGHVELARRADQYLERSRDARFLVTATPVHKTATTLGSLLDRVGQVRALRARDEPRCIELSRDDPLFVDKVRQRPGATFVIGSDTLERLLDPRWGHAPEAVLRSFEQYGVHFLVMGRQTDGRFLRLGDLAAAAAAPHLFSELEGRVDQSSSALRVHTSSSED